MSPRRPTSVGVGSDGTHDTGEGPLRRPLSPAQGRPRLTRRETEVLQAIADGLRTREIATHLAIAEPTVRTYMTRLFTRLSARTRAHAVAIGFQNRLIR